MVPIPRTFRPVIWRRLAALVALAWSLPFAAAGADAAPRAFDVPAGNADQTLKLFSQQAGVAVVFATDIAARVPTNALKGSYPPGEAIGRLLQGTGLTAVASERTGTFTVTRDPNAVRAATRSLAARPENPRPADETLQLSPFEVRSERDTGYVATNSISGTKLATPLREVPIAIQVVTEELIRDLQAVTLEDATRYATGVSSPVGNSEFGAADGRFNLRGFAFASPKRNGFAAAATIDMTNVARVEILKGPASVIYGEATAGGIVNYLTKAPRARPETVVQVQVGRFDFYRAQFETTGPAGRLLGGPVLYRLDASWLDRGSNINDYDQRQVFVSPVVQWDAREGTRLTFQYEYVDRDAQVRSKVPIYNTVAKRFWDALPATDPRKTVGNYNQVPRINPDGTITAAGRPYWDALASYVDWRINNAGTANYSIAETHNFDLTLEQRFSPALVGRVALNAFEVDVDAQSGNQNRMRAGGDGPERFASRHDRGSWRRTLQADLAGTHRFGRRGNRFLVNYEFFREDNWRITWSRDSVATSPTFSDPPKYYYFNSPYNLASIRVAGQTVPLPTGYLGFVPVPVQSINSRQEIETHAFSANDTVSFFDNRLSLLVGLRHQESEQLFRNLDLYHAVTGARVGTGNQSRPPTVRRTVPMAGVSAAVLPWLNLYALQAESFVPQFGTARDALGNEFALRPIVGESSEVGAKLSDPDGRFSATIAGFSITNRNRSRFGGLIATGPLTGQSFTIQTDAEKAKGVELDGAFRPTPAWQILVGYAYTDSKIADPLFAEPVSLIDPNSPRDVRIPGVPRHQINLLQKYTFTQGALKGLAVNFGSNYQGARRGSESAQEVITLPAVWLHEAGVAYTVRPWGRRTEVRLNVTNLFDKTYVTTGPFLGEPLTWRMSVRTTF